MTTTSDPGARPDTPRLRLVGAGEPDYLDAEVVDAETYTEDTPTPGGPVDAPDVGATFSWADTSQAGHRLPIVPLWMQSRDTFTATLRAVANSARYWALFHGLRSPKYVAKVAWYGPVGAVRSVRRVLLWASAEQHNFGLRQRAADTGDAYTWQSLNRVRSREAKGRWWAVAAGGTAAAVGLVALDRLHLAAWEWWTLDAAGWTLAARAGRPLDKPITDRVSTGPRFTKLTAEMVRNALVDLRIPGMTEPSQIEFTHDVHRDGPGWLARVNLPRGLTAVRVLDKRDELSSALRLPMDQVWPAAGPDHAGQLDIWVGYQPMSLLARPRWSLAAGQPTSVFEEFEFGTDERGRPIRTSLFGRSFLIGGQPGSGKSYGAKAIATIALLDPTCELKIAEFKGTGDFLDWETLCSTYVVGVDDDAFAQGLAILRWAVAEAERRARRILAARKRGEAPHGKVTPDLSRRKGSGLHPVVLVFDEVHELFAALPEAAELAERLIKRARALNIVIVLATQIPDKTSLPPNITRCVTNRWCLSVAGQVENDMILGTGSYKRGLTGTVFRPQVDAGWGCMTGGPTPVSVRSHFPDGETATHIVASATAMRGGVVGAPVDAPPIRDLLADLAEVSATNGQHWAAAAVALVERWPEAYPALTADALSELARAHGVPSTDVKLGGRARKGYRLAAVREVIAQRATER